MLVLQIAAGVLLAAFFWRAWRLILFLCAAVWAVLLWLERPRAPSVAPIASIDVLVGLGGVLVIMLPVVALLVWRDRRRAGPERNTPPTNPQGTTEGIAPHG